MEVLNGHNISTSPTGDAAIFGLPQNKAATKKLFSAETSLIHKTDAFLKGIDGKKFTACLLLDMSKAFDSVDLQILLRKIRSVGA